jgi:hypothetical protein
MFKYLVIFLFFCVHASHSQVSEVWASTNSFESYVMDICLDSNGNVYVTGKKGFSLNNRILTIKYNNNGSQEWSTLHNDSNSISNAIDQDSTGNSYITGYIIDSLNYQDIITIKYDTSGNEVWVRKYNGNLNLHDEGLDISVSKSGDVYCLGYVNGPAVNRDAILLKYNTSGALQWTKQINGLSNNDDIGKVIKLDSKENIVIICKIMDSVGVNPVLITKYDSLGNQIWSTKYFSQFALGGIAYDFSFDDLDNIYFTGTIATNGWGDLIVCKYDSSGNFIWDSFFNGIANENDWGSAVDLDSGGNIYVVGTSTCGPPCMYDFVTIKLDAFGNQIWDREYDGLIGASDYGKDVSVDGYGNVIVTGDSYFLPNFLSGYNTLMYDSSGTLQWAIRDSCYGEISSIETDANNNVYVSGHNSRNSNYYHFTTIKYNYLFTSTPGITQATNNLYLSPNPSNGIYSIISENPVKKITVYNMAGGIVLFQNESLEVDLTNNSDGIYICKIQFSDGQQQFIKLIKN